MVSCAALVRYGVSAAGCRAESALVPCAAVAAPIAAGVGSGWTWSSRAAFVPIPLYASIPSGAGARAASYVPTRLTEPLLVQPVACQGYVVLLVETDSA